MTNINWDANWDSDPARIDRNWRAISFELDAPRPGRIERALRFAGLPAHLTRLLVATPALRRAWFVAIGLVMVISSGNFDNTNPRDRLFFLLLLAPLVPVLGVSFAYGIEADPAHEISVATPMRGLRLILTRAAMVLAVSILLLGMVALLAPGTQPMAFAWLIPSFGLTAATVALMTYLPPRRAAAVIAVSWVVLISLASSAPSPDPLAAFTAAGQLTLLTVTLVSSAVIWVRREKFDVLAVRL